MKPVKPESLIPPEGVRFPRPDEFPAGHEAERQRLVGANVTTGYLLGDKTGTSYSAWFEANVHAPEIFEVFRSLALAILPDTAAPIIGIKDEEPILGPYTARDAALRVFEPHMKYLEHDGFLEFGIMFQHHGKTEEVFVRSSKCFQIWTNQPQAVRTVFERHGIPEVPDLEFMDNYPLISESLSTPEGNASWPRVIKQIQAAFEALPPR